MLVRDCETHITNIYTSCCIYSQFKVSIVRGSVQPSKFRCVHHAGPRTTDWIVSIGLQTLRAISCAVGADRMLGKKTKPQLVGHGHEHHHHHHHHHHNSYEYHESCFIFLNSAVWIRFGSMISAWRGAAGSRAPQYLDSLNLKTASVCTGYMRFLILPNLQTKTIVVMETMINSTDKNWINDDVYKQLLLHFMHQMLKNNFAWTQRGCCCSCFCYPANH